MLPEKILAAPSNSEANYTIKNARIKYSAAKNRGSEKLSGPEQKNN